jgi:DNA invertase Pin-like site-specific DNA recombinase
MVNNKIYAYIRISKDDLDIDNQRFEINAYSQKRYGKTPDIFVEDVVSGKKTANERNLGAMLKKLKKDDIFIAASTSRIGRNFFDMIETAKIVLEANAQFIAIQQNFELTNDFQGKMLFTFYSLMAEREREDISLRTKAGIAKRKSEGVKMGRPKDAISPKIKDKAKEVTEYKAKGLSDTAIGKIYGVTRQTVAKFITMIN